MARDATIIHTSAPSHLHAMAVEAGAGAAAAESSNAMKYSSLQERVQFRAAGLETHGAFGPSEHPSAQRDRGPHQQEDRRRRRPDRLLRLFSAAVQAGNCLCRGDARPPPPNCLAGRVDFLISLFLTNRPLGRKCLK